MKVTVHKALLRLLRHSTDEGPLLVLREWKRKELHRDVRVVILQCALELLHTSGEETMEEVWTILESAAADEERGNNRSVSRGDCYDGRAGC